MKNNPAGNLRYAVAQPSNTKSACENKVRKTCTTKKEAASKKPRSKAKCSCAKTSTVEKKQEEKTHSTPKGKTEKL